MQLDIPVILCSMDSVSKLRYHYVNVSHFVLSVTKLAGASSIILHQYTILLHNTKLNMEIYSESRLDWVPYNDKFIASQTNNVIYYWLVG